MGGGGGSRGIGGRVQGARIRIVHRVAVIVIVGDLLRFGVVALLQLFDRQQFGAAGS